MATWTEIDDTRLEPGKPIRSVDGLALRDNPIAIAEGAALAPRIQVGAFPAPAPGPVLIAVRSISVFLTSDYIFYTPDFIVFSAGALRLVSSNATNIQKNGVSVGNGTVDVAVLPGDRLRAYKGPSGSIGLMSLQVYADRLIFCGH